MSSRDFLRKRVEDVRCTTGHKQEGEEWDDQEEQTKKVTEKLTTRGPTLYAQNDLNARRGPRKSRRYSTHLCQWSCQSSPHCAGHESD